MNDELREQLLERIDRNKTGKYWTKVKVLLAEFGFTAQQRVRQSSLAEVLDAIESWGIDCRLSGAGSANDYITLWRKEPAKAASTPARAAVSTSGPLGLRSSPLAFAFHVGDAREEIRSAVQAEDLLAAVWSFKPVCLLVDASDEFFAFAGGYLGAVMRRRALMLREGERVPLAPEVVSLDRLKRVTGKTDGPAEDFPASGGVYLVRDDSTDSRDDELVAFVREVFVPQTYRMKAKFVTSASVTNAAGAAAQDHPDFPYVREWMAAFAGSRELAGRVSGGTLLDLASLLAEATNVRDSLLDRETLKTSDVAVRAGNESTEHMVLKSALLRHLRAAFPQASVLVEQGMALPEGDADGDTSPKAQARPDLRIAGKVWVEVETLRGLATRGSNPLFDLENKLRRKLSGMEKDGEAWLVVPADVALLAPAQVCAIAANLSSARVTVRPAFMDLIAGAPVMITHQAEAPVDVRLAGASWRESAPVVPKRSETWANVAGYTDLRSRLSDDVLLPMRDPERYKKFGLVGANGLLLYGLPGCGKSLIGRVLAGEADITCRHVVPSDLTSMWIGEGVAKTRELFDWALKQSACLLILDEIDAVAPQRNELNMHTDEKRQVNELLAQLDRIADRPVMVVATTNYVRGIDVAVRRCGRFDVKLPVLPPNEGDRKAIFSHYLNPSRRPNTLGLSEIDVATLASRTCLFTPADIKTIVETAARRAVGRAKLEEPVRLSTDDLLSVMSSHQRSIHLEMAREWLAEARTELGPSEPGLQWLEEEIARAEERA